MDIFSNVGNVMKKTDTSVYESSHTKQLSAHEQLKKTDEDFKNKSKEEIKKELQKLTEKLNEMMNPMNENLKFNFNNKADELVVQVIDKKNDTVIREFPPKDALRLMEKMRELVGILFDKKG